MAMPDLSGLADWVVVFDLDDTLYQEDEYNRSGVIAVATEIRKLYGKNITEQLLAVRKRKGDIWESACKLLSLPLSVKEAMLWMYRLHNPTIGLNKKVSHLVRAISASAQEVIILTDGRSITQRIKLSTLGLLKYPLYISEEHSSSKPEETRFKHIMEDFVAKYYVYIADNPAKDFIAPNSLGWKTVGVRGSAKNVHEQKIDGLTDKQMPDFWVDHFTEVVEFL